MDFNLQLISEGIIRYAMVILIFKNISYQWVKMLTEHVTDSVTTVVLPTGLLSTASYQNFKKCMNKFFIIFLLSLHSLPCIKI